MIPFCEKANPSSFQLYEYIERQGSEVAHYSAFQCFPLER